MKLVQTKTEYEWHLKRAKLIKLHMKGLAVVYNGKPGSLDARVGKVEMRLLRPPLAPP